MRWARPRDPFSYDRDVADVSTQIGTLREKPLHASLKRWYARPGDRIEQPVDGFVIDLVRGDLLIEVQTSGLSAMRPKASRLLGLGHKLRIVHSIPIDKWIVKVGDDGEVLGRRKSPKHGEPSDIFAELVGIPDLLLDDRFDIEVVSTIEEEYRRHTPGKSWRRNGWSVAERRLVDVVDSFLIDGIDDLIDLVPQGLPERFTTADLADQLGRPRRAAQQMAYCLRKLGAIDPVGKRGRSVEYRLV